MTEMTYRRLGHSGLRLSTLSFGSWVTFGTQVSSKEASFWRRFTFFMSEAPSETALALGAD